MHAAPDIFGWAVQVSCDRVRLRDLRAFFVCTQSNISSFCIVIIYTLSFDVADEIKICFLFQWRPHTRVAAPVCRIIHWTWCGDSFLLVFLCGATPDYMCLDGHQTANHLRGLCDPSLWLLHIILSLFCRFPNFRNIAPVCNHILADERWRKKPMWTPSSGTLITCHSGFSNSLWLRICFCMWMR